MAGFLLVHHNDRTFVISRVGNPGWVDIIVDRVFCGVSCVGLDAIPCKREKVFKARDVAGTDACLAMYRHFGAPLNLIFRLDFEANSIYNIYCISSRWKKKGGDKVKINSQQQKGSLQQTEVSGRKETVSAPIFL